MATSLTYPVVDEALLSEVVRRIRSVGSPKKIILFGSHARGDAREDSDLDLLIVEAAESPPWHLASDYQGVLHGLYPRKDIFITTPNDIADWANVRGYLLTTAIREGKILYEE